MQAAKTWQSNSPQSQQERSLGNQIRSLFTAHCSLLTLALLLLTAHCSLLTEARAQTVADKMVASVTNGSRATPDLITYSDLVWQLALEPERALADPPGSKDLNEALKTLEDQLLIVQEARKLPIAETAEGQKEFEKAVTDMLNDLVRR